MNFTSAFDYSFDKTGLIAFVAGVALVAAAIIAGHFGLTF